MSIPLLICLGSVYACFFWALCLLRPGWALALTFACAPFPNELLGESSPLKFSLAEVNLLLSVPILLLRGKRWVGGSVLLASLGYIGVGLGCSLLNWRSTTLMALIQVALYLIYAVALYGTLAKSEDDYRTCFHGFIASSLVLAVAVTVSGSAFVFGIHKNNCGSAISAALLISLELWFQARTRGWRTVYQLACLVLGIGLVTSVSRGSWLAAVVGMLVIFALRRQFVLMLRTMVVLTVLAAACWSILPQEKKDYVMGLSKDDWNIKMRYQSRDFAMEQFEKSPVVGVGVGLRKEYDATNFVFCTLAETGVVGLAAFSLLMGVVGWNIWQTHRKVPRKSFSFSVLAIAGALLLGKLAHGMVDHYWVRGTLMAAWASAGMVMRVKKDQQRVRRLLLRQRRLEAQQALEEEKAALTTAAGGWALGQP